MTRWIAPYELALRSASAALRDRVTERCAGGERLKPLALFFVREGRIHAEVYFYGPGRHGIQFALDVFLDPR